ncbi:hypothetical protein LCGC14_2819250 [marine sediment metagenome]|uniref:Uncharacterized protein n=1 Tax=marine sediment metagenome TaxID=412755 RepID=A0A0F9B8U3_9ZZZZ
MAMEHRTHLRSLEDELKKFMELTSLSTQMIIARLENSGPLLDAWTWFSKEQERRRADVWSRKNESCPGNPSGHDPLGGKDTVDSAFDSKNHK